MSLDALPAPVDVVVIAVPPIAVVRLNLEGPTTGG
jgi:hypothetical protein